MRPFVDLRGQDPLGPPEVGLGLAGDRQDAAAAAVGDHHVAALAPHEVARADLVLLVTLEQPD